METYTGKINEFIEWVGGKNILTEINATNGLDVSGGSIRDLILNHLREPFYPYEDKESGLYRLFSSKDAFLIWYNDRENNSDLELFNFVRPSDYEIDTDLTADPRYIMSGNEDSIDAKIIYHWDVKNNSGSYADSVSATYTITTQDNRVSTFSEIYNSSLKNVNVNIYQYLDFGLNTVNVKLRASSTGAVASISFVATVVKLDLTSTFDFNEKHIYGESLRIPIKLTRNDASKSCSIFFYIDGSQVKKIDIPTGSSLDYSNTITDIVNEYAASTVFDQHVVHNLQMYAQTEYNGTVFRSNILYYTFETASSDTIASYFINVTNSFTDGIPPITDFTLVGTQYEPLTLSWGYYTDQLQNNTSISVNWKLSVSGIELDIATMLANSGRQSLDLTFIPDVYGTENTYLIAYFNNRELIKIPVIIQQSSLSVYETSLYNIKMSAYGKTNSSADKNVWLYGDAFTDFTGIEWNDNSGWYNNSLRVSGVDQYAVINYNAFYGNPANGRTIEFEFESEKVSDSSDVILMIGDPNGARIEVTPNKATLFSNDGVDRIHTNFKADERIKLAFIINEESNEPDSRLLYIVNNGILERAANIEGTFGVSSSVVTIGKSNSGIRFYSFRVYPRAISYTDEYNNYVFDSDNKSLIISDNNVINNESRLVDYNLVSNKIDTILISGNLNRILDSGRGKEESITDVTIERFCPFDTTKNFKCENCQIRKHGQSTLNYPISSMKFWLNKNSLGTTPAFTCEAQAPLGLSKNRYKMKDESIPANKFILQANYADSSGVHNGGLQRLIQSTWYNALIDGEYKLRTEPLLFTTNQTVNHNSTELGEDGKVDGKNEEGKQWKNYFDKDFPYDIRIAPDSIPCVVFYKNTEGDNRNTFLGQYVLMEDKKSDFNYGERSIYKAASNDPFCLTVAHKSDDTDVNKIWDNDNVLRIEVLNINNNFTSYMSTTDTQGKPFESIVVDDNNNPTHYRWEEDFEMIYPDPDDLEGNQSKGTDKFGQNSKFLKKAKPFVDWFNWIVGTYKNQALFEKDAAKHLDLYKMAAYYIFMLRCGLTDSCERNAQIKTYDGQHFHYEPWDMDIAFGNKNTGGIAFEPPVSRDTKIPGSVSTYAFSGRSADNNGNVVTSNWLFDALEAWPYWINVVVPKVAQALYLAGLSYENMTKMFDEEYANKWCEIIYNESGYFKYIEAITGEPKLEWLQGARVGHRHWWMSTSMDYYDAKWSVGDFRTHNIYIAANHTLNTSGNDVIKITPTSPTYVALIQNDTPVSLAGVSNPLYTDKYNPAEFDISGLTLLYKVPFFVRGASYIEDIDLSCIASELDIVRFGSAYSDVSGAPLKSVNLGCKTTQSGSTYNMTINAFDLNLSVLSDDGKNSFENLETLNLRGQKERLFSMYNIRQNDLSQLKNVYLMGGQYSSFYSSVSGNNFTKLELPATTYDADNSVISSFTTLDLNNTRFNSITFWNSKITSGNNVEITSAGIPSSLQTVKFTGTTCLNVESKNFVLQWINTIVQNEGEDAIANKSLTLENINWASAPYITYDQLSNLAKFNGGNNKAQDGTMSGYIVLSNDRQLTSEELTQIRNWFGESVFNKNSSGLVIDQLLDYMRINIGAEAVIENGQVYLYEGNRASLNATKFSLSEDSTQYNWFLRQPGTNNNVSSYRNASLLRGSDGVWYIKADESNYGNYTVEVVCTGGTEVTSTIINIVASTYPTSYEIATSTTPDSQGSFVDVFQKENVGAEMYVKLNGSYTASVENVTFSLTRNNDGEQLLRNVPYTTFKGGDNTTTNIDQYLKYRKTSIKDYGIVIISNSVPTNDDMYTYTLTVNVMFKSGVSKTVSYTFTLLRDDTPILANDNSLLYQWMLNLYRNQTSSDLTDGVFYRQDLLKLTSAKLKSDYYEIESLKTLTGKSIFDYLLNVTEISLAGATKLPSVNEYIVENNGKQLVFNKIKGLTTLELTQCASLSEDIIDLTGNTQITGVDAQYTSVSVVLPEQISLNHYVLGIPTSINLANLKSVTLGNISVQDPTNLQTVDIINIPGNKSFTVFDTIFEHATSTEPSSSIQHVRIELSNVEEYVSSDIVQRLYNFSKKLGTTDCSLKGRLSTQHAYLDEVDYLNNNYTDLYITSAYYYLKFESDAVRDVCVENWGDDYGLSTAAAANVTAISNTSLTTFADTGITDISWLKYFTKADIIGYATFNNCKNITKLVLPPSLKTLLSGTTAGGNLEGYIGCFAHCDGLKEVIIPEGVEQIGISAFFQCENLERIDLPSTTTHIFQQAFNLAPKLKYVICRAIEVPNMLSNNTFLGLANFTIYVPDSSVDAYKEASNWITWASRFKPLSEFEQDAATNGW